MHKWLSVFCISYFFAHIAVYTFSGTVGGPISTLHIFQLDLVVGIVLNKHSKIGALPQKILEVFALLDYLIYRIFQLGFPR